MALQQETSIPTSELDLKPINNFQSAPSLILRPKKHLAHTNLPKKHTPKDINAMAFHLLEMLEITSVSLTFC